MKIATVLESSEPVSIIRRQRGIISVERRKWITVELSFCCRGWLQGKRTQTNAIEVYEMTYFYQSADDAEGRKPQVLERPRFRCCIEKRVQEQRDVSCTVGYRTKRRVIQ